MPDRNNSFAQFEEELRKKNKDGVTPIEESISFVKKELKPLLDAKLESNSVVANSMDAINGAPQDNSMAPKSNENVKVRSIGSRIPEGMKPIKTSSTSENVDRSNANYNVPSGESFENVDMSLWRSGATGPLILVATAVLVLLVFVVSYLMFNSLM